MSRVDAFDTPPDLAEVVVEVIEGQPASVADFAAGTGNLLAAAEAAFGSAIFASDVDANVVRDLKRREGWTVSKTDFLRSESRQSALVLNHAPFDCIVLNPPFSQRGGGSTYTVDIAGESVRASKAMAFTLQSVAYLVAGGEIAVVLPTGCSVNQRDRPAVSVLEQLCDLRVVDQWPRGTFAGCAADMVLMHGRRNSDDTRLTSKKAAAAGYPGWLVRGTVAVHSAKDDRRGLPFVHTTDLQNGLYHNCRRVTSELSVVSGPFVTIPRVGKPNVEKVAVVAAGDHVLSDCVFAIRCSSGRQANAVAHMLRDRWPVVESQYAGTCARHVTKEGLMGALRIMQIDQLME